MKKRSLAFVLGVIGALALVACKSETVGVGGGGSGGNGGAACATSCPEALNAGCIEMGSAGETEFNALIDCSATSCASECAALNAGTGPSDTACGTCLQNSCGTEFTACSNAI